MQNIIELIQQLTHDGYKVIYGNEYGIEKIEHYLHQDEALTIIEQNYDDCFYVALIEISSRNVDNVIVKDIIKHVEYIEGDLQDIQLHKDTDILDTLEDTIHSIRKIPINKFLHD